MNQAFITLLSGIILFIGTINLKAQELNNQPTPVIEVKSLTGKIWMDRNLDATQEATSSRDVASYGYLYQWGRLSDGHQKRSSPTTKNFH